MNEASFQDLVDRLGEDLSGWPEALRGEAEELLSQSADARVRLTQALNLRRAVRELPSPVPRPGLAMRVMNRISLGEACGDLSLSGEAVAAHGNPPRASVG